MSETHLLGRKRSLAQIQTMSNTHDHSLAHSTSVPENLMARNIKPRIAASEIIMSNMRDDRDQLPSNLHPHEFLIQMLRKESIVVEAQSFDQLDIFQQPTAEEIEAYSFDVIGAVRSGDLETLKKVHEEGRPLKCSNQFGESLLHLACRKQKVSVVRFLVEDAGVPLTVCDDFGRTPLHDACWTPAPNFELVDLIVSKCPDLLFVKDRRGHSPLFYARRDHWDVWITHLAKQGSTLSPRLLRCQPPPSEG